MENLVVQTLNKFSLKNYLKFQRLHLRVKIYCKSPAKFFNPGHTNEGNESGNGDIRNPLNKYDVPFVPEEFRSSHKRIIFDKNDFVSLLPSSDSSALKDAILTVLVSTQNRTTANETRVSIIGIDYSILFPLMQSHFHHN